jgi:hypothetical protein
MLLTCIFMWGLRSHCVHELILICHINCNELKKLVAHSKTRKFVLRMAHIQFMSVELFCGIVLSRGGVSFKSEV